MTELPRPTAIRLSVSFAQAVYRGSHEVEGVRAELSTDQGWPSLLETGRIALLVDPDARIVEQARPDVLVDAIMAKRNTGTARAPRRAVIALGPGFTAGGDADAVIETMRGHELGRVIRQGTAAANTGLPGDIAGRSADRVLRAPSDGWVTHEARVGDIVARGQVVLMVGDQEVSAPFDGCLRGLIDESVPVTRGMKIGDVDPRGDARFVRQVSDKAHAVGRAALEAALTVGRERGLLRVEGTV